MNICIHLWKYLPDFFLEWEMFETNVEKIKTHILCSLSVFQRSCSLWDDNVEKCGGAIQATDDNMI